MGVTPTVTRVSGCEDCPFRQTNPESDDFYSSQECFAGAKAAEVTAYMEDGAGLPPSCPLRQNDHLVILPGVAEK